MIEGAEKLGVLAAELMQQFEEAEIVDGFKGVLGEVLIVAEINVDKIGGGDEDGVTAIRTRSTNAKQWVQLGLLNAGIDRVRTRIAELTGGGDEDED